MSNGTLQDGLGTSADDWLAREYLECTRIGRSSFQNVLTLAKYSLVFNGTLGAALGFLHEKAEILAPPAIQDAPNGMVAFYAGLSICVVAVLFNVGALFVHRHCWHFLEIVSKRAKEIEDSIRRSNVGATPKIATGIYEGVFNKRKFKARWLNIAFYSLLSGLWTAALIFICNTIFRG
ncbi:hypothetical protein KAJ83_01100 [Marivibrio halodurans]|uniref:Uncharacterized protein n=1 Tax=Marivibrio halodurans TaxID=2039722 RepID=A0A8J7V2B7_9PROT|nr:hypothetical protein [Marivibrio halodurans]MBP5855589.1 hypothetical protein [Marivibrio halodurans]